MKKLILSLMIGAVFCVPTESLCIEEKVADSADMIIFSYDRPLQLCALLDSIDHHVSGLGDLFVIYRSSSPEFEQAYQKCFALFEHRGIKPAKQKDHADFKSVTIHTLRACSHDYFLFAVDDNIVKDSVDLTECVAYLRKTGAYGFYLRLGENIVESYTERKSNPLPWHTVIDGTVIQWKFNDGIYEWRYPNTVDMTVYKKGDLIKFFDEWLSFGSPNTLEAGWAIFGVQDALDKTGLCYKESKIMNIPFNLVQDEWPTSYHMGYSKAEFLRLFNDGFKIDTTRYHKTANKAPHAEAPLHLIRDKSILSRPAKIMLPETVKDAPAFDAVGYNIDFPHLTGEYSVIKHMIKNGDIVFDVGANIGDWSAAVLADHPRAVIHAFEPVADFRKKLGARFDARSINLYEWALSNTQGVRTFDYYKKPKECGLSGLYHRPLVEHLEHDTVTVQTKRLDTFCREHAIDHIDFLKIDTEGSEFDILRGSEHMLKSRAIATIQFEYGGAYRDAHVTLKDVYLFLRSFGYELFRIVPDKLIHITAWRDALENYQLSNYLAVADGY